MLVYIYVHDACMYVADASVYVHALCLVVHLFCEVSFLYQLTSRITSFVMLKYNCHRK